MAVGDIARQFGLPMVAFSKRGDFQTGGGVYRLGPTGMSQVKSLVDSSYKKLGLLRYALVYPEDSSGQEFADAFRAELTTNGLELIFEASYYKNDKNGLVTIAEELENHDVQAVFLPDNLSAAAHFYGNVSAPQRARIRLLGIASWDNPVHLANSQTVLDGVVFVSPFFLNSKRPIVSKFVETFRYQYRQKPNFLAAQAFDVATMVAAALRRQVNENVSFQSALQGIQMYDGLTGKIQVDSGGEIQREFRIVQLHQGQVVELFKEDVPSYVYRGNDEVRLGDLKKDQGL